MSPSILCEMSLDFVSKNTAVDGARLPVRVFNDQVAGHTNEALLSCMDGHFVLKPMVKEKNFTREVDFYRNIARIQQHCVGYQFPFAANYFGVLNVTKYRVDTLTCNSGNYAAKQTANKLSGSETVDMGYMLPYLVLESLVRPYTLPNVIDIKMGTQTYEPIASAKKIAEELAKYPYQHEVGFRITGYQSYDFRVLSYRKVGKQFGRNILPDKLVHALAGYFFDGIRIRVDVIVAAIQELKKLLTWMKSQNRFHFYCSSILIIYDADLECGTEDIGDAQPAAQCGTEDIGDAQPAAQCGTEDIGDAQPAAQCGTEDIGDAQPAAQCGTEDIGDAQPAAQCGTEDIGDAQPAAQCGTEDIGDAQPAAQCGTEDIGDAQPAAQCGTEDIGDAQPAAQCGTEDIGDAQPAAQCGTEDIGDAQPAAQCGTEDIGDAQPAAQCGTEDIGDAQPAAQCGTEDIGDAQPAAQCGTEDIGDAQPAAQCGTEDIGDAQPAAQCGTEDIGDAQPAAQCGTEDIGDAQPAAHARMAGRASSSHLLRVSAPHRDVRNSPSSSLSESEYVTVQSATCTGHDVLADMYAFAQKSSAENRPTVPLVRVKMVDFAHALPCSSAATGHIDTVRNTTTGTVTDTMITESLNGEGAHQHCSTAYRECSPQRVTELSNINACCGCCIRNKDEHVAAKVGGININNGIDEGYVYGLKSLIRRLYGVLYLAETFDTTCPTNVSSIVEPNK